MAYTKYEECRMKAEAIEKVGNTIEMHLEQIKEDIGYHEAELSNYKKRVEEGENLEWLIESTEKQLRSEGYEIHYWELVQKTLDKELIF